MFVSILLVLNDELGIAARVALAILALLTPSILISFGGLIFPKRSRPPPSWPSVLSASLVCYIALMLVWRTSPTTTMTFCIAHL